ncbi:MAG: cation transporter [Gemmatimonadaceae bacterium]
MAMPQLTLEVEGMSCAHCVRAVDEALKEVPGVIVTEVRVGSATVSYDPALADLDALLDAVADAGYSASEAPATGSS